ncbi:uncharacterized protein EKO05_0004528 [Ascochyta rabiei]|uniref:uncharacterized protein n=1 Tax=Didymella rabiei TaxID=5454 RepID=UPI002205690E|nr:uncharacterized protein EKO05_0004528 [Ascochyta rabiei]UPX14035.1 hypothetical protein EKO05_0004528 [Ascochyta rabiei]
METPHAPWCQCQTSEGYSCDRPCRWNPPSIHPHLTRCQHIDRNAPCHFLKLPTELRQEIFKYLMPTREIDPLAIYQSRSQTQPSTGSEDLLRTVFPMPLLSLYLGFNREVYEEVKDVFYSTATFTIDVSRDGVMLCGRRILVPNGPDGSRHYSPGQVGADRFIRNFAWAAARNYTVIITVELKLNGRWAHRRRGVVDDWDEEVEIYDIRDFVAVVISGVLAKSRLLRSLQVRVNLKKFYWAPNLVISVTKLLVGPFERLRCVQKPRLMGTFCGDALAELYAQRHRPGNDKHNRCITPTLPNPSPIMGPGMAGFDFYAAEWECQLSLEAPSKILNKSPMTQLFMEFRAFYNSLANIMPHIVGCRSKGYLHRARVAREHEDIAAFRAVRAELVQHWHHYLAQQEFQRAKINASLQRMIRADVYPYEHNPVPAAEEAQNEPVFIDLT